MKQFYKDERIQKLVYYEDLRKFRDFNIFIKFVTRNKCKTGARFEPTPHTID